MKKIIYVICVIISIPLLIQLGINSGEEERVMNIVLWVFYILFLIAIIYLFINLIKRLVNKSVGGVNPPLSKFTKIIGLTLIGYLSFSLLVFIAMGGLKFFFQ